MPTPPTHCDSVRHHCAVAVSIGSAPATTVRPVLVTPEVPSNSAFNGSAKDTSAAPGGASLPSRNSTKDATSTVTSQPSAATSTAGQRCSARTCRKRGPGRHRWPRRRPRPPRAARRCVGPPRAAEEPRSRTAANVGGRRGQRSRDPARRQRVRRSDPGDGRVASVFSTHLVSEDPAAVEERRSTAAQAANSGGSAHDG